MLIYEPNFNRNNTLNILYPGLSTILFAGTHKLLGGGEV
jgi:hypothetical protein